MPDSPKQKTPDKRPEGGYGICGHCGREIRVKLDGTLRSHASRPGWRCLGKYWEPR